MQLLKSLVLLASAAIAMALPQPAPGGNNVFTFPTGGDLQGTINLAWTPGTPGTVSLYLVKGVEGNQKDELEISKNIPNTGAFTWSPPSSLQDSATITDGSKYAFRIQDDQTGAVQYSAPIGLTIPGSTFVPPAPAPAPEEAAPSPAVPDSPPSSSTPPPSSTVTSSSSTSASSTPASTSASSTSTTQTPSPTATSTVAETSAALPLPSTTSDSANEGAENSTAGATGSSSSPQLGLILGATFGAILGLAILVVLVLVFVRKYRAAKTRKQMRSSGFQRGMEEVEREHAEYMQRVAAGEQNASVPARQPSTKQQPSTFMGTAF